ncbi:hypothetical protein BDV11DRAFT_2674 [Aspergillus similis]
MHRAVCLGDTVVQKVKALPIFGYRPSSTCCRTRTRDNKSCCAGVQHSISPNELLHTSVLSSVVKSMTRRLRRLDPAGMPMVPAAGRESVPLMVEHIATPRQCLQCSAQGLADQNITLRPSFLVGRRKGNYEENSPAETHPGPTARLISLASGELVGAGHFDHGHFIYGQKSEDGATWTFRPLRLLQKAYQPSGQ